MNLIELIKSNKKTTLVVLTIVIVIILVITFISSKKSNTSETFTTLQDIKEDDIKEHDIKIENTENDNDQLLDEVNKTYENSFITVDRDGLGPEYNLTYGELTYNGMKNIRKCLKQNNLADDTFIDLGSGNGRTLFYGVLSGFKKSKGVEIVEPRHKFAVNAREKLKKHFGDKIELKQSDIFNLDSDFFPPNTAIFMSNLLFPSETNQKLIKFLSENTKADTVLIVSRLPENLYQFKLIEKIHVPMSWSENSDCYVLKKQ